MQHTSEKAVVSVACGEIPDMELPVVLVAFAIEHENGRNESAAHHIDGGWSGRG